MAVIDPNTGKLSGTVGSLWGPKTFQPRLGQDIVKNKPSPMVIKGLKDMSDVELSKIAQRTRYTLEGLKRIQTKQRTMDDALEYCRRADLSDPKFNPTKPGETRFNRCVGLYLSGKIS